jgi:hypothetical protein
MTYVTLNRENMFLARLMPVILTTPEAEIRRMVVQSQPQQIVPETLSQKYPT